MTKVSAVRSKRPHAVNAYLAVIFLQIIVIQLFFCALGRHAKAETPPLSHVRLQLKWKHQFQFAGYYAAIDKGYFQDAGLDVELLPGKPNIKPIEMLLDGKVNYTVMSPTALIEQQHGAPLVMLATIFQHSATAIMTRKDSGIAKPEDLLGKKVMFTPYTDAENRAMLLAAGISPEDITIIDHTWNLQDLISGKVDAQTIYVTNEPYKMQELGIMPQIIRPADYGIDFYGDCLVTTKDEVTKHLERTEAFRHAVQQGWRYAMNNPQEIAQLILKKYAPEKTLDELLFEAAAMQQLVGHNLVDIGYMSLDRWKFIAETYARLTLIKSDYELHDFLYPELREKVLAKRYRQHFIVIVSLSATLIIALTLGLALLLFTAQLNKEVRNRTVDLTASEQKFRSFFELASAGFAQVAVPSGRFLNVNEKYCEILGYSEQELQKLTIFDITLPEDMEIAAQQRLDLVNGKIREFTVEKRFVRKDGRIVWVTLSVAALWNSGQKPESTLAIIRDITKRKQTERELALAANIFENSIEGIVVTDENATILQVNKAFCAITGYRAEEVTGQNPRILKSNRHSAAFYEEMWREILAHGQWSGEIWNRRKSGEVYPEWLTINAVHDKQGAVTHYVSIFHDISELKKQQETLEHQAQHDALTGLPNRTLLNDRLQEALKRRARSGKRIALLFFDVDNFKNINDGFGHSIGDSLLIELSGRLQQQLRASDTLARQGGDEFLILAADLDQVDDARLIASRLLTSLTKPFSHDGVEYFVTASIGVTLAPEDGNTAEILIKNADMAMYRAKKLGRNNFQFFTPELDVKAHQRIAMEAKLRKGLEAGEFELHFQPQVLSSANAIIGAEALIRWRHDGQLISPAEFIPLAEESGLILPLGAWVVKQAVIQAKRWQDAGYRIDISVNISSRQFVGDELVNLLQNTILSTGLESGKVYFEITESILMEDIVNAQNTLNELRKFGCKFYLDDFGTGYSSLSYLKRLPLDGLKIDRSFIRDLEKDADSRAIAAAIISLANTLNLSIVAEGVETVEQLRILEEMSKQIIVQGYLASKPVEADSFTLLLEQNQKLLPIR